MQYTCGCTAWRAALPIGRLLPGQIYSTEQENLKLNVERAALGHLPGRVAQRQIDCKRGWAGGCLSSKNVSVCFAVA